MRIFVTGSAGCLAAALLPVLCNDPSIEKITGIDIRPTRFKHPKLSTERLDIRAENLTDKMAGHDAVIHLAFAVQRRKTTLAQMHDVNVRGSRLIVDAANKNGIQKLINLSSASVYGSGEDIVETVTFFLLPGGVPNSANVFWTTTF
jgi:UDP-glucose 4-epimerase